MDKLRTCIVGIGNISRVHIDSLLNNENTEIVGVCDIIKERADSAAEKTGAKAFYDFDEMIDWGEFDVLHICTPHYLHAPMAIKAMNAGKHVLCEKPPAMSYPDAVKAVEAAEKNSVYFGVCYQNRYNPSSVKIKEILDSKKLGAVTGIKGSVAWNRDMTYYSRDNWHGTLKYEGGGVLINQAIHTLDLIAWLCPGNPVKTVGSVSQKRLKGLVETEDTADALITFDSGVTALFYASLCYSSDSPVEIQIDCEKGRILFNGDVFVFRDSEPTEVIPFRIKKGEKAYWGDGHTLLINDFYNSIRNNVPFAVDGKEGLTALKIISDIYSQNRN